MDIVIEQINSAGKTFVEFAWPMLWQVSVLIAILLAADWLLRRKVRAVFRYWLWMLVLAKLFLPTTLSSPVSIGLLTGNALPAINIAASEQSALSETERPVGGDISNVLTYSPRTAETGKAGVALPLHTEAPIQNPVVTPAVSLTREGGIFLVWLMVVCAMLLLLVQRAVFVCGLVRQSAEATGLMNDALKFCCNQMGVRQTIRLKVSPNATSPAVCGLFRPVILVPQGLGSSLGINSLRMVLMHELAHIKRGDLWVNLLQTVLQIAYFYNPLLWLANWVIRRVREQAVDEAVQVALGERAQQYPETLLNVARLAFERPALSLRLIGVVESKSALTSRIKRMLTRPIPKTAKLGIIGSVVVILLAAILLPMAKATPPPEFIIKGTVIDTRTGKPIAGAKVGDEKYSGGTQFTYTDTNGNYSYKTWYEEHNVKCEASGYKTETKVLMTKALGSERERVLDFTLSSKIIKDESGKVTYRVNDKITLEILGITNWPVTKESIWWSAAGTMLNKPSLDAAESKILDNVNFGKNQYSRYYLVVCRSDKPEGATVRFHAKSVSGNSVGVPAMSSSKEKFIYVVAAAENTIKAGNVVLTALAADGDWKTVKKFNIPGDAGSTKGEMTYTVADAGLGKTIITLNSTKVLTPNQTEGRVVAIDKKGQVYTQNRGGGVQAGDLFTQQIIFELSKSDIDHLEIQDRPFVVYEFHNVSFEPGVKTDVQVVVEGSQSKAEDTQPIIQGAEFGEKRRKNAMTPQGTEDYSSVTVREGIGFDGFIIGDANCTGEFIKAKLGEPEKENKSEKEGWWLVYRQKYGLDFWLNLPGNTLQEIRLNKGFKGKLGSGISMFSTKQGVFKTYGEPIREAAVDNLNNQFDDRVLFIRKDGVSRIDYREKGVLFWFEGDKLTQIRVGAVSSPGGNETVKSASTDRVPSYTIDFETVSPRFAEGDSIEIKEIVGTAGNLQPGNRYIVRGRYKLASADEAKLCLFATNGETKCQQGLDVGRGEGQFERTFDYLKEGGLHLSFYPVNGGNGFGGVYFTDKGSKSKVPIATVDILGTSDNAAATGKDADVAVEDFDIQPYPEGGLYTLRVTIQNESSMVSPQFRVYFYPGDPNEVKPMIHEAGPIKPGDAWNEGSMPFALKEGTNEITVILDPIGQINDLNRTNNRATMNLVVKDGKIVEKKVFPETAAKRRVVAVGAGWQRLKDVIGNSYRGSISGYRKESFQQVLSWSRPGDTFVTMLAFDEEKTGQIPMVPKEYEDLLPKPYQEIKEQVERGETVELKGESRGVKTIVLAAATVKQLEELIESTELLQPFKKRVIKTGLEGIQSYGVYQAVRKFPEKEDLSTPEAAYASINRVSASGDQSGWQRVSVKEIAENLAKESKNGKTNVEPEWAKVLLNAKILEARICDGNIAVVFAELPQEFTSEPIRKPIDIRYLKLEDGKWLNTGNDRVWTIEEARTQFDSSCKDKKTDKGRAD
jgi:beta-lactamase regulating signal transducer with metallopeptidase domain